MSGTYLNEAVIWLNDPSTLTNSGIVTKGPATGSGNWARFSNKEVDELHFKFRNSADAGRRKAAYVRIQEIVAESASTIIIGIANEQHLNSVCINLKSHWA